MSATRCDLLRKMPVFGGLKDETLEFVLAQSHDRVAAAGDYFFREGDPGDSLFVIESGTVLVQRNRQGERVELGCLASGDCFGEMSLIDFQRRSASVMADSNCEAIEIPNTVLRAVYKRDLEQYAMIMMNLGREVSRRLRIADECLFQLQNDTLQPSV